MSARSVSTYLAAFIVCGASPAFAAGQWSPADICGAAATAYFFLGSPPTVIGATDGWTVLRSEAGNTYDCKLDGKRVRFRWKIDRGPMTGGADVELDGSILRVRTDMGQRNYRLGGGGWSAVD